MFRIGQKVVCVSAANTPGHCWFPDDDVPVVGSIYTVYRMGLVSRRDNPTIELVELKRSGGYAYGEWRFRPVVERKTDISVFTKILTGKKVDA